MEKNNFVIYVFILNSHLTNKQNKTKKKRKERKMKYTETHRCYKVS